jgi:hypothetical protein
MMKSYYSNYVFSKDFLCKIRPKMASLLLTARYKYDYHRYNRQQLSIKYISRKIVTVSLRKWQTKWMCASTVLRCDDASIL